MSNIIYQVCVGDNPPPYYAICIESVRQYCMKYGITHKIQREPILKIRPLKSQRSKEAVERMGYLPIYEKENAFNWLDEFDKVCIVDCDIFIQEHAPNIFDTITNDEVFAGVTERDMPLTPQYFAKIKDYGGGQYDRLRKEADFKWNNKGPEFFNMGLMLFTRKIKPYLNGQTPAQFIRRPEFERFVNGEDRWRYSTDQTLLNYWIKKYNIPVTYLNWKWNGLYKGIEDRHISRAYFVHFFLSGNMPKKGMEIPEIIRGFK